MALPRGGPSAHRRTTELRLVAGGYAIIVTLGSALVWLTFGQTAATIALVVMLAAGALFVALWLLLKGFELISR
jgi:hypothetical protein